MSLCYEYEKWTMITLASVAISLTVGLVLMQVVHGQDSKDRDRHFGRVVAFCLVRRCLFMLAPWSGNSVEQVMPWR